MSNNAKCKFHSIPPKGGTDSNVISEMITGLDWTRTTAKLVEFGSEMIMEPEWTPAGVCILGWSRSRSQYFRFEPEQEPESTLRSVQEPI